MVLLHSVPHMEMSMKSDVERTDTTAEGNSSKCCKPIISHIVQPRLVSLVSLAWTFFTSIDHSQSTGRIRYFENRLISAKPTLAANVFMYAYSTRKKTPCNSGI